MAVRSTPVRRQFCTLKRCMNAYDDQEDDEYYVDDFARSFEHDSVYALDAWVRHTVNQAFAQAIRLIKQHLIGFAEQQGWVAQSGAQAITEPSLSGSSQGLKQGHNPHAVDFESLIRTPDRDHDYNAASSQTSKSKEDLALSSSDQGEDPSPPEAQKEVVSPGRAYSCAKSHPDLPYGCLRLK
ncbi:hypothetical protein NDU88_000416 [Pleurodeles waltl]|uniref:Uncharacterized protein n=1 Tax=Pleurodeles waltl TaxID=8319 RepID=A0AAV7KM16_PLEWA|nr:hypothetical protein NDU88_000416 [Pleurodeles waltl]